MSPSPLHPSCVYMYTYIHCNTYTHRRGGCPPPHSTPALWICTHIYTYTHKHSCGGCPPPPPQSTSALWICTHMYTYTHSCGGCSPLHPSSVDMYTYIHTHTQLGWMHAPVPTPPQLGGHPPQLCVYMLQCIYVYICIMHTAGVEWRGGVGGGGWGPPQLCVYVCTFGFVHFVRCVELCTYYTQLGWGVCLCVYMYTHSWGGWTCWNTHSSCVCITSVCMSMGVYIHRAGVQWGGGGASTATVGVCVYMCTYPQSWGGVGRGGIHRSCVCVCIQIHRAGVEWGGGHPPRRCVYVLQCIYVYIYTQLGWSGERGHPPQRCVYICVHMHTAGVEWRVHHSCVCMCVHFVRCV